MSITIPNSPIRVLLVDDHPIMLEGIRLVLAPFSYIEVVGAVGDAAGALVAAHTTRPHVVLLDLILPDADGIDVCQQLLAEQPALRIVALTNLKERRYLMRLREVGAVGYILKDILPEELAAALVKVHAGKVFFSDEMQELLAQAIDIPTTPLLTRREKEVLSLIAEGLTSHEISNELHISHLTVETHRRNLLSKFESNNTATLIKHAAWQGLI